VTALAAFCGLLIVGGIWLAVDSIRPVPIVVKPPTTRTTDPILRRRVLIAAGTALAAFAITRWPIGAVAGLAVGWVAGGLRGTKERQTVERRTEAIALWAEMLRDAIGTARGIEGVLVATAATSPLPIRAALQTMAQRLQNEPLDTVLEGLAADLDHALGDLVVTALRLASTTGGHHLRDVLHSVANAAYAEAESHRRVEVARERPRSAMKYTAFIIGGFVVLLVVFSHRYLAPYDSALGQVVLALVGVYWAAGFWWMNRMGRPEPVERFLATTHEFTIPEASAGTR
jgi:tight adherence protein B